jgi:hypothetical protein
VLSDIDFRSWPETEVRRRFRFDRDRVKSGHNSDIAKVKRLTQLCHPAVKFAVLHNAALDTTM